MPAPAVQPMISITFDPEQKTFTWSTTGLKPMGAMGLMVDVLCHMHQKYIEDPMRPPLPSEARICLEMTGDKVAMAYRPETAQPLELQGMLVTALIGFSKRSKEEGFDPYEAVLGALLLDAGVSP